MKYKIGICICTFKRPLQLKRLLESLVAVLNEIDFTIIVIDNDENGSAKEVCEEFKDQFHLIYGVERKKGLSNARNRCVKKANELELDYIVFLDDDEIVIKEDWLLNLIRTSEKYKSPIVTGPVRPFYHSGVKEYVKKSGYFAPGRYANGTRISHTGTGNTLIKLSILEDMEPVFSDMFNLSGGEDTYLFSQLVKAGNIITWCDDAEVFEYIPLERANFKYIFKRSFYSAVTFSNIQAILNKPQKNIRIKFVRILKGVLKIAKGACLSILSLIVGKYKLIQGISLIGKGLGDIGGTIGMSSYLYKD